MKVWKWYKNLTKEQYEASQNLKIEDRYPLYAFTNDKKIRDLFRKMRNKERYIELKSKMTEEEYVNFVNNHRGCLLEYHKYSKIVGYEKDSTDPLMEDIRLLTTWDEKEYVQSSIESFSDTGSGLCIQTYPFPPFVFNDKYFKALHKLQYVDYWKLYTPATLDSDDEATLKALGADIDYSYPTVIFDEFAIFVNLFGDMLKL